jgi:hypothetical protein
MTAQIIPFATSQSTVSESALSRLSGARRGGVAAVATPSGYHARVSGRRYPAHRIASPRRHDTGEALWL